MNLIIRKRDVYISIGAILAFSAFVGYSLYDNSVMHAELKDKASYRLSISRCRPFRQRVYGIGFCLR